MGKKRRDEKLKSKAVQAKASAPLSGREMLKVFPALMLRAFVVVMPLTLVMTFMGASGLTLFNNFWVQMGCYVAAYMVFGKFIFGPVRNLRRQ